MSCPLQIKISVKTKERLDNQKDYKRETYDDVVIKLLDKVIEIENIK